MIDTTLAILRRQLAVTLLTSVALFAAGGAIADTRALDTAYGEVTVNGEPQRIVTIYEGALDVALAAGAEPLGAVATRGSTGVASYLQEHAQGVAIVGNARELNLEAIAALQPDLILASPQLSKEQYQLLAGMAPTVVPKAADYHVDNWKSEARLFAAALGREEAVDQAIAQVEERAGLIAEKVREAYSEDDRTAYLVRWMPQGALVMSAQLFSTGLLAASGFDAQDGGLVKGKRPHSDLLSLENLSKIDGDWMFLATLNEDGRTALDAAQQSPAFKRLQVVQRDRVIPVDGQVWSSASGPLAAQALLDQLESALAEHGGQ